MPESPLDEKMRAKLAEALSPRAEPVLLLSVEGDPCAACQAQQSLLEAVAALSNKLVLEVSNRQEHRQAVEEYAIDKFPATVPLGQKDCGE